MQLLDALAWIGAGISMWGTSRYALEITRGNTRPRLASWIAWATANGVLMAVALLSGNMLAATFNGLAASANIGVLVLSAVKRAGDRPSGSTDWTCLGLTAICLAAIIVAPYSPYVAFLAMAANIAATWPTMQHAWRRPKEEAWQLFAANAGANGLGLIGVVASGGLALANIAGPLISTLGNAALVAITVGRGMLTTVAHEVEEDIAEVEQYLVTELEPARAERAE